MIRFVGLTGFFHGTDRSGLSAGGGGTQRPELGVARKVSSCYGSMDHKCYDGEGMRKRRKRRRRRRRRRDTTARARGTQEGILMLWINGS